MEKLNYRTCDHTRLLGFIILGSGKVKLNTKH